MDHTKCKTFIAFVNVDKKDKFWCDGNSVWDTVSPKIFPYETKEEKEDAKLTGYHTAAWSETGDEVYGVIFKACETVPIISKKEALQLEEKHLKQRLEEKQKILDEDKPKKESKKEIPEPVKIQVPETKKEEIVEKRGRGRPRKNLLDD